MTIYAPNLSALWAASRTAGPAQLILILAAVILVLDPVIWLIGTWRDPAYASDGYLVFAVVCALFVWSVSSARIGTATGHARHIAFGLLVLSACVRLAGQVLAINGGLNTSVEDERE